VPTELQALKSDILYVDGTAGPLIGLPSLAPGTGNCHLFNRLASDSTTPFRMYKLPPALINGGVNVFPTCL
jgi:hypothetical protein